MVQSKLMASCTGIQTSLDKKKLFLSFYKVLSFNNLALFLCKKICICFVITIENIIFAFVIWNANDIYNKMVLYYGTRTTYEIYRKGKGNTW